LRKRFRQFGNLEIWKFGNSMMMIIGLKMKWKIQSLALYRSTAPSPWEKEKEDEVSIWKFENEKQI